jgi:hypothetical protein
MIRVGSESEYDALEVILSQLLVVLMSSGGFAGGTQVQVMFSSKTLGMARSTSEMDGSVLISVYSCVYRMTVQIMLISHQSELKSIDAEFCVVLAFIWSWLV